MTSAPPMQRHSPQKPKSRSENLEVRAETVVALKTSVCWRRSPDNAPLQAASTSRVATFTSSFARCSSASQLDWPLVLPQLPVEPLRWSSLISWTTPKAGRRSFPVNSRPKPSKKLTAFSPSARLQASRMTAAGSTSEKLYYDPLPSGLKP